MKKSEIIVFSIFGVLLAFVQFIKNFFRAKSFTLGQPFNNKSIPTNIFEQMHVLNRYCNIATIAFRILFIVFLLYIGWKIAYGFLGLRHIIPITLCILMVSALIEFIFMPNVLTVCYNLRRYIIDAAIWIGIMEIYYITSKKTFNAKAI